MAYTVYAIRNVTNGRTYVGMTTDLRRRLGQHRRDPPSRMLQDSQEAQGSWSTVFQADVLQIVHGSHAEAQRAEADWIQTLQTTGPRGYNNVEGGLAHSAKLRFLLRTGRI